MTEFLACLIGFILGAGATISAWWKSFDDAWDTSYKAGYRHGVDDERIRQANELLEARVFETAKEVEQE